MTKPRTRTRTKKPVLDPKLVAFCEAYLQTLNKSEAYRMSHPGCKVQTSWTNGERALRNEKVQAYLSKRLKSMIMSSDEVLVRISRIASGSLRPFMDIKEDGFAAINLATDDAQANLDLIKEIETTRTRRMVGRGDKAEPWEDEHVKIKIADPKPALDSLAKYHKLFADEEDERILKLAAILEAAKQRANEHSNPGS